MRYLVAYIYFVMSGVAVPFALQANDLIGRDYLILAGEITASSLLIDFLAVATFVFFVFALVREAARLLFRRKPHLLRRTDSCALAIAGFGSASFALTDHEQVYGNTWDTGEAFMAFVAPAWPVMLAIVAVGVFLGTFLMQMPSTSRKATDS